MHYGRCFTITTTAAMHRLLCLRAFMGVQAREDLRSIAETNYFALIVVDHLSHYHAWRPRSVSKTMVRSDVPVNKAEPLATQSLLPCRGNSQHLRLLICDKLQFTARKITKLQESDLLIFSKLLFLVEKTVVSRSYWPKRSPANNTSDAAAAAAVALTTKLLYYHTYDSLHHLPCLSTSLHLGQDDRASVSDGRKQQTL
ncbi:uncharacterized protein TRIREDRAFT_112274 [Trichoderma reesei QM6a]|uniref:Predicted protein n=1 Tax=Hypocrea jecorina (strain QM6a) TaxID=431241 RepID=G0RWM8_HYPJQ|nr:uncharacterized protein TRIREDRAFT_112274 [Trichoderma reesei QM6a]EGR44377.1 predicted protein [Trichoderma reesei QM6a]